MLPELDHCRGTPCISHTLTPIVGNLVEGSPRGAVFDFHHAALESEQRVAIPLKVGLQRPLSQTQCALEVAGVV